MLVVCKEHLELALDIFVDEYEAAPDVYDLSQVSIPGMELPTHCARCSSPPQYVLVMLGTPVQDQV